MKTHKPVLLDQVLRLIDPIPGERYFDGTAGYGGHAQALMGRLGDNTRAILVDRDPEAVEALRQQFGKQARIIRGDYLDVARDLLNQQQLQDLILLDLGVSSPQLEDPKRGFSFRQKGPLDMRMDPESELTAAKVVNTYPEQRLAQIIWEYGEERRSRAVAKAIVRARPLQTTAELAQIVRRVVGGGTYRRIDPATRTFQAIRIEVNQEISILEEALPVLTDLLAPGGRLAVISFHSLEDRMVKHWFRDSESLEPINRKPVKGDEFDANNPRARSAKLRVARKLKPKPKEAA